MYVFWDFFLVWHSEKKDFFILRILTFSVPLHKTGIASATPNKLGCDRLALSLHKTVIASATSNKLGCARLALSLYDINNT
ncbi:hypothetical protein HMPREF2137_09370 [Hoylesella buccalis DNF00853]|uniref:Uncharacterized protein n=1 Tax=Hoylesella buccalis DNF00853 TaxID=1401074 RepID=A0A095ZIE9_9BACT|nr:hypothetical protein HMPREF2137_09370 [Hoylesella buccalis DNF00853]